MAKVNANKFMGTDQSGLEKKIAVNSQKISLLKNIIKAHQSNLAEQLKSLSSDGDSGFSSGLDESIKNITNSVTSISETLRDTHKFEKDQAEDERHDEEISKRGKRENESEKERFSGLKKTATKILAPVKNMFDTAFGWLQKLFFAKAVLMFFDWFSDEKNQGKVESVVRFFKDWWPVLLAGYIAFATPFIPFTIMMIGAVKGLVAGIITAIGYMKAAAISMGPWGWTALAVLAGGAAIYGIGKMLGKDKVVENETERANSSRKGLEKAGSTKDLSAGDREALVRGTRPKDAGGPGSLNNMPDLFNDPLGLRHDPTGMGGFGGNRLNSGGQVPGSGPNEDSVPTMLTPGEFVMSRGAVEIWGADVLAGMNAAAGGTNKPTPMSGYNQGGLVGGIDRFGLPGLGGGGGGTNALTEQAKVKTFGGTMEEVNRNWGFIGAEGINYRTKKDYEDVYSVKDKIKDALNALDFTEPEAIAGLEGSFSFKISPVGGVDRKLGVEPPTRRMAGSAMNLITKSPQVKASGVPIGMNNSGSGNNIPSFSVGTKVSSEKIKVLGITR